MALLPSVGTKISVELTRYRSAVSEFLAQTLGKSINYLLDREDTISTTLNAASVSTSYLVNNVTTSTGGTTVSYTAPAGRKFVGTALVKILSSPGATVTLDFTDIRGTFSVFVGAAPIGTVFSLGSFSSSGGTVSVTPTNGPGLPNVDIYFTGLEYETASLAVP